MMAAKTPFEMMSLLPLGILGLSAYLLEVSIYYRNNSFCRSAS